VLNHWFRGLVVGWLAFQAITFLYQPPYWSMMDDVNNRSIVMAVQPSDNWIDVFHQYNERDRNIWGMYRPVYPIYIFSFYSIFADHPEWGYTALAIVLTLLVLGWARLFSTTAQTASSFWIYAWLTLIFTPNFNLYFFSSLQEKFIWAGGLGLLWTIARTAQNNPLKPFKFALFGVLIMISCFLGFLGKATFLYIGLPAGIWLLWEAIRKPHLFRWLLFMETALIFVGFAVYFMSIRTAYSSGYDLGRLLPSLLNPSLRDLFLWSFVPAGLAAAIFPDWTALRNITPSWNIARLIWPLGYAAFILIMLPWKGGISAYYITGGSPFAIGCVSLVFLYILQSWPSRILRGMVIALSLVVTVASGKEFYRRLSTQHGTQQLVRWIQNEAQGKPASTFAIPVPCYETRGSLGMLSSVPLSQVEGNYPAPGPEYTFLITHRDCPIRTGITSSEKVFEHGDWAVYR